MKKRFYVASWSGDDDRGIYSFDYDFDSLTFGPIERAAVINNASYFARFGNILYAVSENQGPGDFAGELHSFRITSNGLEVIDSLSGMLTGAPHISVSPDGCFVFICSYNTGMTCSVETNDGHFGAVTEAVKVSGHSIFPGRQDSPHAHIMCPSADGYIICCDLGTDELISYHYDNVGQLSIVNRLKLPAGYGPRHMVFSKDGRFAYVVCELQYHLLTLSYSGQGNFSLLRDEKVIKDLPEDANWGGAIKLDFIGDLLFTSNRPEGRSSIDVFSLIEPSCPHFISSANLCNHPRDFLQITDDRGNEYMMCLSMTDNLVRMYSFDRISQTFEYLSELKGISKPVCVVEA